MPGTKPYPPAKPYQLCHTLFHPILRYHDQAAPPLASSDEPAAPKTTGDNRGTLQSRALKENSKMGHLEGAGRFEEVPHELVIQHAVTAGRVQTRLEARHSHLLAIERVLY